MKTTEEKVIEIIRSVKEIKYPITKGMSLNGDLSLDSLDMNMLFVALESKFAFEFDLGEIEKFKTVGDIIQALENQEKLISVK